VLVVYPKVTHISKQLVGGGVGVGVTVGVGVGVGTAQQVSAGGKSKQSASPMGR